MILQILCLIVANRTEMTIVGTPPRMHKHVLNHCTFLPKNATANLAHNFRQWWSMFLLHMLLKVLLNHLLAAYIAAYFHLLMRSLDVPFHHTLICKLLLTMRTLKKHIFVLGILVKFQRLLCDERFTAFGTHVRLRRVLQQLVIVHHDATVAPVVTDVARVYLLLAIFTLPLEVRLVLGLIVEELVALVALLYSKVLRHNVTLQVGPIACNVRTMRAENAIEVSPAMSFVAEHLNEFKLTEFAPFWRVKLIIVLVKVGGSVTIEHQAVANFAPIPVPVYTHVRLNTVSVQTFFNVPLANVTEIGFTRIIRCDFFDLRRNFFFLFNFFNFWFSRRLFNILFFFFTIIEKFVINKRLIKEIVIKGLRHHLCENLFQDLLLDFNFVHH